MPIETIPLARTSKWYTVEKIRQPAGSLDGTMTTLAATAYTEGSANLIWYSYHFEWKEIDVESARRNGVPLQSDDIRLAMARMDKAIERLIIQGSMSWDPVDISGLKSGATDVDAALDDNYWNTQGEPYNHALAGYSDLIDAGYEPPFVWVLSSNLRPGLAQKDNDYSDRPSRALIADAFGIERFVFLPASSSSPSKNDLTIYPMFTPAGDDGCWMMMKADRNNFALQEVSPPRLTIIPEMDVKTRTYYGRLDWVGTMRITHADSVIYEDQVDLVA